jgi:rubrerythrin
MSEQFYLQDSRSYVGNDVLFWAKDGKGYTTDLRNAHIYSKEDAVKQHESRPTDIPWPKNYIDAKTRPAVDMQYIKRDEALQGTGIKLIKEPKPKKDRYSCHGCGRFITETQFYCGCPNCGASY